MPRRLRIEFEGGQSVSAVGVGTYFGWKKELTPIDLEKRTDTDWFDSKALARNAKAQKTWVSN